MTEDTSSHEVRSDATPDVIVLGAGFSKAVFAELPTTDQLGEAVRCRLNPTDQAKLPVTEFKDGRFEEWLSYLAQEQPHLAEDQALEARALLYRVTAVVRVVLAEIQARALAERAAPWVYEFLSVLHVKRATVLSLNYDNLIECCLGESFLKAAGSRGTVSVTEEDVLGGLPPCADFPGSFRNVVYQGTYDGGQIATWRRKAETFRLLKLHGSLSWYWVPGDTIGATLQRWLLPGTFGDPRDVEDATRERVLPSREAYIVPPSALKSRHFQNPISRQLWRWASEALSSTTRVVLIGYSAPAGDRTFQRHAHRLSAGATGRGRSRQSRRRRSGGTARSPRHSCWLHHEVMQRRLRGAVDRKREAADGAVCRWTTAWLRTDGQRTPLCNDTQPSGRRECGRLGGI